MTTKMTVGTAPRDLEGLKKIGRFNNRLVAEGLGLLSTEEGKKSFLGLSNDQQVQALQTALADHDKKAGGGGGASVRQPSNKNAGKAGTGAAKPNGAATTSSATSSAAAPAGEGAAKLLERMAGMEATLAEQNEQIANLTETVQQLQRVGAGTNRLTTVAIGLGLKLAEQVLGAGPDDVLGMVVEDQPSVEAALRGLVSDGSEPEAEGEAEEESEGNE